MRMVINLVSNGIKYGQSGGHLDIRLKDTQEGIVGEVEDDGIGIAPENLDRIWDRFYQEDSSRTSVNQGWDWGYPW